MTIKWSFSYNSIFENCPFTTQFTYNMVHSYGPQKWHYKGTALYLYTGSYKQDYEKCKVFSGTTI